MPQEIAISLNINAGVLSANQILWTYLQTERVHEGLVGGRFCGTWMSCLNLFSSIQNTVAVYMWDVHCNTQHLVYITATCADKFPNIMTIRWNDIILAPVQSLYIGSEWSSTVVWPARSILEFDTAYRVYHVRQHGPSSVENKSFMTGMLHSAGRWYGNVCAVAVLPDRSVRHMKVSDLILLRCALARYGFSHVLSLLIVTEH